MKRSLLLKAMLLIIMVIVFSACSSNANDEVLSASGTISADAVDISPEVSGIVQKVYIQAGDRVQEGDALFTINDEFIQAQYDQAAAGLSVAQAALTAAQEQQSAAEIQLAQAEQGARQQELQYSAQSVTPWSDAFDLPQWYYDTDEIITALQAEVDQAEENLSQAKADLNDLVAKIGDEELSQLEADLAQAQVTYVLLEQQLNAYKQSNASDEIIDTTQKDFDEAATELDRLELAYDRALSDTENQDILDARAKVQAAQDRLNLAQLSLDQQLVGNHSLMVSVAEANVSLAKANVTQAQAGLEQAQAAEKLAALQLEKTTVYAPCTGVVLSESLAAGELIGAGTKALSIAQLENVELTVYIPEDKYGLVSLGESVQISVDSFPDRTFNGEVTYIADEAEFTPRNVQTVEGRKATVYGVQILISNPDYVLKPGMPADVIFN